jgi:hypothetical protein
VFVVGCPRSGTTLLQRLLDHHPALAVTNDTHFIPRCLPEESEPGAAPLTPALVERVRGYRRFHRMKLEGAAVERAAAAATTYAELCEALYDEVALAHGKPLAGEKTPDYCRHLPLLGTMFPWARFVHIIRDGRDVALSAMAWATETKGPGKLDLWRTDPVATCALWWRWQVRHGKAGGAALGAGRYLEVRYEELVRNPEAALQDVAEFLELRYDPLMLRFHEGRTRDNPQLSAKSAWLPVTPGLRDWREHMSTRDLAVFEALAGDLLTELGYELCCGRLSDELEDHTRACRAWWVKHKERPGAGGTGRGGALEGTP